MAVKNPNRFEYLGVLILVSLGIAGLGGQLAHFTREGENLQSIFIGVIIPSKLCIDLIILGYWTHRTELNSNIVAGWSLAGALVIASGSMLTVFYQSFEGVKMSDQTFMLLNGGIGGAIMGSVIGIYDATNRKTKKGLSDLHETTTELISSENSEEIYEIIVETASNVLGIPKSVVYEFDEEEDVLTPVAWTSEAESFREEISTIYRDNSKIWEVFDKNELEVMTDKQNTTHSKSVKNELILPLGKKGVMVMATTKSDISLEKEFAKILGSDAEAALKKTGREQLIRDREKELRKQRNYLAALFNNTTDAIARVETIDNHPIVKDVNPAFERIFGYEKEEIVGKSIDEFLVPEEEMEEAREMTTKAKEGQIIEKEVRRKTKDGVRDFLHRSIPYRPWIEGSEGYAVYTDITERKRRERRLEVLNRVLRHDIRNHINVIMGNAEILREDPEDKERILDSISEKAHTISDLSDKARQIEKSLRKTERAEIDISELVEERANRFKRAYSKMDNEINIEVETNSEETLVFASSFFHLALDNVLENAVEHSDKETVDIEILITNNGNKTEVRISDNGPGIPEEEIEVLERNKETDLSHTSGLGLWIVKWIVEESDGKIDISTDSSGTVVCIQLPRSESAKATKEVK